MKTIELNYKAEFASEVIESIPYGYINKTICGCGLTTVALENAEDTIVAVPTIYLAVNKEAQYPNKRCNYEVLAVWGEVKKEDINDYVTRCTLNNQPIKIMVTYDGLRKVEHLLDSCRLIIDESNDLLAMTKQPMRREAISYLFDTTERMKNQVSFISATPIDLKYMPKWISTIDQVTMTWGNTTKSKPILAERTYPFKSLREEFIKPLQDKGSLTVAGKTFSKVIVFLNSVTTIKDVVKQAKLKIDDCGIICGDSLKNDVKIAGINRYTSGVTPKYLFITSSGFSGIDIYDDESMTIVVSNTSKTFTMIDMMTDLKQAVSRNRSKTNPNYGSYIYIYNQSIFSKTEDELLADIKKIYRKLESAIMYVNQCIDNDTEYMVDADFDLYTKMNNLSGYFEINEEAFNADKYFILETRTQYTKGFDIQNITGVVDVIEPIELPKAITYTDLVSYFNANHKKGVIDWDVYSTKSDWITIIESTYRMFKKTYNNITEAKQMIDANGDKFKLLIIKGRKMFNKGERYSNATIKQALQKLYDKEGINRKAKATDIYEFFGEKGVKAYRTNSERGFEIK